MELNAPWITCRMGKKLCLLARNVKAYYIIEVGKKLDYATEEWLESQGVSEELLKELQLPFTYIPRKAMTSVGFSGYQPGDLLYLYSKDGKRILELASEVDKGYFTDFFSGIPRTKVQKRIAEKHNPNWRKAKRDPVLYKKLWWVPAVLSLAGLLVNFGYRHTGNSVWFTLSLLVLVAPIALVILMPGYFTIFFSEKNKKQDARSLEAPLFISLVAMMFTERVNILDGNALWWLIGIGAAVSGLLCLLAEEFRRKPIGLLAAVIVGGLFGAFALAHMNVVYAPEEPQSYVLAVEETRISTGKNTSYYCTVILPDGREESLSISRKFYESLEEGDPVRIEVGKGLFGIEYANIYPYEEGE